MPMTTFGRIVKIIDWVIDRTKGVGEWFKGMRRAYREKQIDDAVANRDIGAIKRILLLIREKREARRNKS